MAKIIWQKRASRILDERVAYASAEFGKSTAKRWIKEIAYAEIHANIIYPRTFTCREKARISLLPSDEQKIQVDLLLLSFLRHCPHCRYLGQITAN